MGSAYIVLGALAALGVALGWRLTPVPAARRGDEGLARLLQLGVAFTGMLVLALLLVPWFSGLAEIGCTPEAERAGKCIVGVEDRGLFGASAFACLVGAGVAFILRKGVLDFPEPPPPDESQREAGVGDMDTRTDLHDRAGKKPAAAKEPARETESKPRDDAQPSPKPEPEADRDDPDPDDPGESEDAQAPAHRRLEGPVFRAFVDDEAVDLDTALETAVKRLGSERVAVVFSRGASKDANLALLELAEIYDAHRYVLEGTAAATEGIPTGEEPDPHVADEIAGPTARHAGELALDLAGTFIQTVFLLDTRVAFPKFVLDQLTRMESVCIAHAHDEVSAACQVVLPGTNPGEREGELIDSAGGDNSRRSRAWLVSRMVERIKHQRDPEPEPEPTAPEPTAPEPSPPAFSPPAFSPPQFGPPGSTPPDSDKST